MLAVQPGTHKEDACLQQTVVGFSLPPVENICSGNTRNNPAPATLLNIMYSLQQYCCKICFDCSIITFIVITMLLFINGVNITLYSWGKHDYLTAYLIWSYKSSTNNINSSNLVCILVQTVKILLQI